MVETPTELNNADQTAKQVASAPTANQIGSVIVQAAQAATSAAITGSSSQGTISAFQALEDGVTKLAEGFATEFGGPLAGGIASEVIPEAVPVFANALATLFNHIGSEIPADLKALIAKL